MKYKKTQVSNSKKLMEELKAKHREIKQDILRLVERANTPNYTKDRLKEELFKLYLEIK